MNSPDYQSVHPKVREALERDFAPMEYSGKELKKRLNDDDKITMFEQRKAALQDQIRKGK